MKRLKRFLRTARSFFTQIDWIADNWREQVDWWWHWHKWGYGDRVPPLAWAEEISKKALADMAKSFLIKPQLFEPRTSASYAPFIETGRLRGNMRMSGYQTSVKYTAPTID
jgi:hypothetical protein